MIEIRQLVKRYGAKTAVIRLREDFVPRAFYELSDRLGTDAETEEDTIMFEISKVNLSTRIWASPLERSFNVEMIDRPLPPGELPTEMQRKDYWDNVKLRQPEGVS